MTTHRVLPLTLAVTALFAVGALDAHAAKPQAKEVIYDTHHDVSRPMRDIVRELPPSAPLGTDAEPYLIPNILRKPTLADLNREMVRIPLLRDDASIQRAFTGVPAPMVLKSFDGMNRTNSGCGCEPPDTNGDINEQYFFQWVNTKWALYNKDTGAVVPNGANNYSAGNSFWAGFGGKCQTTNSGDPVVLWDSRAKRWMVSQFVAPATGNVGAAQCFAISTTSDPLGTYNRYEFPSSMFGDYPHIGIWVDESGSQDAYLLTTHDFDNSLSTQPFMGATLTAVQRDQMLQGLPAAMVRYTSYTGSIENYGVQALHLSGDVKAPSGSCPSFVHFYAATSEYLFWDLCLDWATPANSTLSANPTRLAAKQPFLPNYDAVAQNSTTATLDSFGDNTMYRASARAFPAGAPERVSVVINHSVKADADQGGVKWVHFALDPVGSTERIFGVDFESANALPPLAPSGPNLLVKKIRNEGVYAPDANTRWLGGIAVDANGNIGLGYSASSAALKPQVRVTGRTLADPAGTMRDEQSCVVANGAHTGTSGRWGDYSSMSVDPTDQCTFWFTTEYFPTNTASTWSTRVCSFKFDNCGSAEYAVVSDTPTRVEMCGATATADPSYALRVGVLNGYNGAVTLAAAGFPGAATPSFSVNPLTATPGASVLTLVGGKSLPSGEYNGTVSAVDGASTTRNLNLELGVSALAPAQPLLSAPANNAAGVKVVQALAWSAASGALKYRVQVATDAAFSNIVASATVTGASWSTPMLNPSTQYYWRVTPVNYCGDGAASTTFTFTTGIPGQCPAGTSLTNLYTEGWDNLLANGWTTDGSGGTGTNSNWTLTASPIAATGFPANSNAYYIKNNTVTSDRGLVSPSITIPAGVQGVILSYDVWHNMEYDGVGSCYDGLYLQAKVGADPAFSFLGSERMFTDAYTGPWAYSSTIKMWCTVSGAPKHAIVDLDSFAGQSLKLRFDAATDGGAAAATPNGVAIDNVKVDICQ